MKLSYRPCFGQLSPSSIFSVRQYTVSGHLLQYSWNYGSHKWFALLKSCLGYSFRKLRSFQLRNRNEALQLGLFETHLSIYGKFNSHISPNSSVQFCQSGWRIHLDITTSLSHFLPPSQVTQTHSYMMYCCVRDISNSLMLTHLASGAAHCYTPWMQACIASCSYFHLIFLPKIYHTKADDGG